MNTHWLNGKTADGARREGGFTLLEMVISVVLLSLITGAISAAFVSSLNATAATKTRVKETNDAQLIAAFFTRDAQAAGGTNPTTGTQNLNLGVTTPGVAGTFTNGCITPGTPLIGFKWIDLSSGTTYEANYSYITTAVGSYQPQQLLRTVCSTTTPTPGTSILANNIITTATGALSVPSVGCSPACSSVASLPQTVFMTITDFSNTASNVTTPYTFTLTASLRPQAGQPSPAPSPLILLGSGGDCSTGATGLNVSVGSTLQVFGQTYINATNAGCHAMNLAGGSFFGGPSKSSYFAGGTSILNPGSCTATAPTNGCPTTTPYTTPISDPYKGLTPPNPNGMPTQSQFCSSTTGAGYYPNGLTVVPFTTCTLTQSGIYYLQNNLVLALFGSLQTAPGVHALIYIANGGSFSLLGTSMNITGMTTGDPYPGLAIWQAASDNSPMAFAANFTSDINIGGVIYAAGAAVTNTIGGGNSLNVNGIVAKTFSDSSNSLAKIGIQPASQPTITGPATIPSWTVARAYPSTTITATGGFPAYAWTADDSNGNSTLPPGLTIDPISGTISGTPSTAGHYTVQVTVDDIYGDADSQSYGITINAAPTITTTPPDWTVGFDYHNFPMNATGGTPLYTWGVQAGNPLPTGLSINAGTGVISGIPTTVGTFNTTITLQDAAGATTTRSYTVHINSLPTISGPATLPSWTQGSLYPTTQITTANGTGPFTWVGSNMPAGLSLNASGQIVGTPTVAGNYPSVKVTATDTAGAAATQTYSITVNGPLGLGGSLPNGEITRPYSYNVPTSGGTSPFTFSISAGALPAGLTLSAGGVISGTPTAVTNALSVTIKVKDSTGATTTKPYTLTIVALPTISGTIPNWTVNRTYPGTQLSATGGLPTVTLSQTGLPAGLTMTTSGLITGTPTATGTSTVVVTVTDGTGYQTTQTYTVVINGPPSITTGATLLAGETTVPYSKTLAESGGTPFGSPPPFTWTTSGGIPAGLSLSTSGVISGTPTATGVFSFSITVADQAGASASQTFTLNIVQGPSIGGSTTLPPGEQGVVYPGVTLTGTGGTGTGYTFSAGSGANALPAGLAIGASTGQITGTPTVNGTFNTVKITITDSGGGTLTQTYTIVIASAPTISTGSPLPPGELTIPYNTTLAASGGSGTYTAWSKTAGTLPPGLSLNAATGAISGTPTATGTFSATYTVTDSAGGTSAPKTLSITTNAALSITTASLPAGVVGQSYNAPIATSGGTTPFAWSETGAMPGGLSFNTSTGAITGTPTTAGSTTIAVTLTDSLGAVANATFTITVTVQPKGVDVQSTNGANLHVVSATDTVVYTFSTAIKGTSIIGGLIAGGATVPVSAVLNAPFLSNNTITVSGANLGSVDLGSGNYRSFFSGNITYGSSTLQLSADGTTVTLKLGGGSNSTAGPSTSTLKWTPSASATDLAGNPVATTQVTESGSPKSNF